jgi:hypothetical protein
MGGKRMRCLLWFAHRIDLSWTTSYTLLTTRAFSQFLRVVFLGHVMRMRSMKREAVVCRAMARGYAGRPEEPFLLKVANTFEELALVTDVASTGLRTDRGPRRLTVVAVRTALNQRFAAAIQRPRLILCWAFGHDRSPAVAFESSGVWHSLCHRCSHPLRRQSAGRWQEITSDEMARARTDASGSREASKPSRAKPSLGVRAPPPPTAHRKKVGAQKKRASAQPASRS